MRQLKKIS